MLENFAQAMGVFSIIKIHIERHNILEYAYFINRYGRVREILLV